MSADLTDLGGTCTGLLLLCSCLQATKFAGGGDMATQTHTCSSSSQLMAAPLPQQCSRQGSNGTQSPCCCKVVSQPAAGSILSNTRLDCSLHCGAFPGLLQLQQHTVAHTHTNPPHFHTLTHLQGYGVPSASAWQVPFQPLGGGA